MCTAELLNPSVAIADWPLALAPVAVQAGFPSPAEDFAAKRIDLTAEFVIHPQATFLMRVAGESMQEFGIADGDIILVDRAIRPRHQHIVVAVLDSEFTLKQLYQQADGIKLRAGNPMFPDIVPKEGQTLEIWGVVTRSIKQHVF